jgi:hypothetical protein
MEEAMTAPEKKSVRRWTMAETGHGHKAIYHECTPPTGKCDLTWHGEHVEVVPAADYDAERRAAEEAWAAGDAALQRAQSEYETKLAAAEKKIGELEGLLAKIRRKSKARRTQERWNERQKLALDQPATTEEK